MGYYFSPPPPQPLLFSRLPKPTLRSDASARKNGSFSPHLGPICADLCSSRVVSVRKTSAGGPRGDGAVYRNRKRPLIRSIVWAFYRPYRPEGAPEGPKKRRKPPENPLAPFL